MTCETLDLLSDELVLSLIEEKGTKITTVEFLKADGSVRVANGLFKPSSHIIGSERGYRQGQDMKERGLIPFYDLKKKAWISFYKNRVLDIR